MLLTKGLTIVEVPEEHHVTAGRVGVGLGVGSPAADIAGKFLTESSSKPGSQSSDEFCVDVVQHVTPDLSDVYV